MAFKRTRQHREHNRICDFLTNEKQGHSQVVGLSYIQMVSPLVLLQLCQLGGPLRQLGAPIEEEDIPKLIGFLKRQEANGRFFSR